MAQTISRAEQVLAEEERAVKQGAGAAVIFAILALLVAVVALGFAFSAEHRVSQQRVRVNQLETHINTSLGGSPTSNNSTGAGPNSQQPAGGTSLPNGNGQ